MNIKDKADIPKKAGIYRIYNKIVDKSYIGSSINLKNRIHRHIYELNNQSHNNKHLLRCFNKYGEDSFSIHIELVFDQITIKELQNIEKQFILKYDTLQNGFNQILDNSTHFRTLNTCEQHVKHNRKLQSKAVYAICPKTGEIVYEFQSISDAAYFFKTSTSNISRVCKGSLNHVKKFIFCYKTEYNPENTYIKDISRKGVKFSENHKLKIKKALTKFKGIVIFKYDQDFNMIEEYVSISEAEKMNNIKKDTLRYRIDKKTLFGGYYWSSIKL